MRRGGDRGTARAVCVDAQSDAASPRCSSAPERQFSEMPRLHSTVRALCAALLLALAPDIAAPQGRAPAVVPFDIASGPLADALERFAEQSGLSIVYSSVSVRDRSAPAVAGAMPPAAALDRLLAGTDIRWRYVDDQTVALEPVRRNVARAMLEARDDVPSGVAGLGDLEVVHDPSRPVPREPSGVLFGIGKPLLETPRAVSFVGAETIDLLGLSAVEDLVRVVPGVYTTTRWGIQGSIDVRNVPADTYFRGMKRLNLQGHGRSVLAAVDGIEVVKGPSTPLYGMGKIGGYTNMVPRSVRAATGGYWSEPQGYVQMTLGSFEKSEVSFGIGGPLPTSRRQGGYYVYGLVEESHSHVEHVPIRQRVLQASFTLDELVGDFRLEAGMNLQRSGTAGALLNRFTQELADHGRYIRGVPLVDLDVDGNGSIGFLEMHARSPVEGKVSAGNRPLQQYWAWPTDADGVPLPVERFPTAAGIPQSLYDYLLEHPEADPTGLLRAQGPGGPVPISGRVPVGFALDPRTVGYGQLDPSRPGALERELEADFVTLYLDLIDDADPSLTVKNQLFFDAMQQHKLSELPFSQRQDVYVVEDKLTVTRVFDRLPGWIDVQALATANVRYTSSKGRSSSGDYATHRSDAMHGVDGALSPGARFATSLIDDRVYDGGMPWTAHYATDALEIGAAMIVDVVLNDRTTLTLGARFDRSKASNVDYGGVVDLSAGSAENPVVLQAEDRHASGWDSGVSWSLSVSRRFGAGFHPYLTVGESTLALDGNNNKYSNDVIEHGHIGKARLAEIGLKAALLDDRLYFSVAGYQQARRDARLGDPTGVLTAYVSATSTEGWEAELGWTPTRNLSFSLYALQQVTRYTPNVGEPIMVDARVLGFRDVIDADGNVIYPAEAFLYGGRSFLVLPDGFDEYEQKQGNPGSQHGFLFRYELPSGLGFTLSGNHFSSTYSGRLKLVEMPAANVLNAGVYLNRGDWQLKWDVWNLLDERYFRARTGDTLGDVLVSAMPGRRWQASVRVCF